MNQLYKILLSMSNMIHLNVSLSYVHTIMVIINKLLFFTIYLFEKKKEKVVCSNLLYFFKVILSISFSNSKSILIIIMN